MSALRVAVVGAAGKMGRFACDLLEREAGFEVAARIVSGDDLAASLAASGADVGLDLTVAGLGYEHGLAILRAGLACVVGTSGVTVEEVRALDEAARAQSLGGIVVPNFSVGAWLLERAAALAAPFMERAEIVETHHAEKRDAPSSTARSLARAIAPESDVAIHSLRLPGVLARHEVVLGGSAETLRLCHETIGREAFGPGILASVRYAKGAVGVAQGLGAALEGVR